MKKKLDILIENIINNDYKISYDEAIKLVECELGQLMEGANKLRKFFNGTHIELCSIINGKCGKCSEDCKFCAQSIYNKAHIDSYDILKYDEILELAKENEEEGVHRYSIVTSGKGLSGREFQKILGIYHKLNKDTNIRFCASIGIISEEQLKKLKNAGVERYHHNLESSREFYSKICTTHSYDDRIETIQNAKKTGLDVCSGGIIGMGETFQDRIKLAIELRNLEVKSIPINVLMPIKGTALEYLGQLSKEDILRTFALFKIINPKADIRFAAGRDYLDDNGKKAFLAGVSSAITGNYLTTSGNKIKEDIELIKSIGFLVD